MEPSSNFKATWAQVKDLADHGQGTQAIELLLKDPFPSDPNYFYSLGTLYLQSGDFGKATVYLEKAHSLLPRDAGIINNLNLSRESLTKTLGIQNLDPGSSSWDTFFDSVPTTLTSGICFSTALVFAAWWLKAQRGRSVRFNQAMKMPQFLVGIFIFLLGVGSYAALQIQSRYAKAAVLIATPVRSGPGDTFAELAHLDSGIKLRFSQSNRTGIREDAQHQYWVQVRYSPEGIGWVKESNLLLL